MSEIFRDRTEGTQAKRQELLRRRREELVTMPHAVRRVIVARASRVAAAMAGTLCGVALIAMSLSPSLAQRMASYMPGIQPAPLSTLLSGAWLLGVIAWAVSRARVEHRFAVEMSKYVLPSTDLDHDVERLDHEHPDEIARQMGHRLEVRSAAWPVLAASVVLPATALWVARAIRTKGWPVMSEFEAALALHAGALAAIGVIGCLAAIAVTRKSLRTRMVGDVALAIGVMVSCATVCAFVAHKELGWPLLGASTVLMTIGLIGRALKSERDRLEVDDPAAGAEIFTIRGALKQVRETVTAASRTVRGMNRKQVVMSAASLAIIAGGVTVYRAKHREVKGQQIAAGVVVPYNVKPDQLLPLAPPPDDDHLPYTVTRVAHAFEVRATLNDKGELVVPMIGFSTVPRSWRASLEVTAASNDTFAIVNNGSEKSVKRGDSVYVEVDACKEPQPLALSLRGQPGESVVFEVVPDMTIAACQ